MLTPAVTSMIISVTIITKIVNRRVFINFAVSTIMNMTNLIKILFVGICLCAVSCVSPSPKTTDIEFIDSVADALAGGGQIDLGQLQWTREPAAFEIKDGTISITTAPHTDLWQRTYYHFRNDNAPVLQMKTREKYFSFVVKTDFTQSHQRFDQCGIVMYLDSENWLKGSVEFENEEFQHLGSVATNNGYSDWATTAIPADVKTMWYRFSRRADDYCIECSTDGVNFSQMRICHMYAGADEISFGIYACSPEESSFTAVFSDMKITECMWKAHDGQQPDE